MTDDLTAIGMNDVYNRQAAGLIFISAITFKLASLPGLLSGTLETPLLAIILETCVELLMLCIVFAIVRVGGIDAIRSKVAKSVTCVLVFLYLGVKASMLFLGTTMAVRSLMFDQMDETLMRLTFTVPVMYIAYKGVRSLARSSEIVAPIMAIVFVISLCFTKTNFDFGNNLPLFGGGFGKYLQNTAAYGMWYCDAVPFMFITLKYRKRPYITLSVAFSYALVIFCYAFATAIFGDYLQGVSNTFIELTVFNFLTPQLGRLDWIGIVIWVTMVVFNLGFMYWGATEAGTRVVGKRKAVFSALLVALLCAILFMKESKYEVLAFMPEYNYAMWALGLAVPTIAAIALLAERRKRGETAKD